MNTVISLIFKSLLSSIAKCLNLFKVFLDTAFLAYWTCANYYHLKFNWRLSELRVS